MPLDTSAMDDSILLDRDSVDPSVAIITLNRPDRLNALTSDMGPRYARVLQELAADPAVRAVVVTGAGRGFCSGADLASLSGDLEDLQAYVRGQSIESLPAIALTLPIPVVTAINGPCAGIGFVLGVSADARFVHVDATLSSTFARLGLVAEYGIAWLLPRLIGLPMATELLLTGRTITGREADAMGLATATENPLEAALDWARTIATHSSPTSVATMKRQLLQASGQSLTDAIDSSLDEMDHAFAHPDLAEALLARVERRDPSFPPRAT